MRGLLNATAPRGQSPAVDFSVQEIAALRSSAFHLAEFLKVMHTAAQWRRIDGVVCEQERAA